MAKAPWYKRYASDFVSDPYVQAMTAEQYGWYSAMLDMAWIHTPQGYMPNAIDLLCRMIGRCDEMHFAKHSQIVLDRFKTTPDGKWLYHPKMVEQVEKLSKVTESKRENGKRGADKRWHGSDSKCHESVKQTPIDSDSDSDSSSWGSDLHPLQYASMVLEDLALPDTKLMRETIAAAIAARANETGNPKESTTRWLISQAKTYKQSAEFKSSKRKNWINWFANANYTDDPAKWEQDSGANQSKGNERTGGRQAERISRNRETLTAALRARHPDMPMDGHGGSGSEGRITGREPDDAVDGEPVVLPPESH